MQCHKTKASYGRVSFLFQRDHYPLKDFPRKIVQACRRHDYILVRMSFFFCPGLELCPRPIFWSVFVVSTRKSKSNTCECEMCNKSVCVSQTVFISHYVLLCVATKILSEYKKWREIRRKNVPAPPPLTFRFKIAISVTLLTLFLC